MLKINRFVDCLAADRVQNVNTLMPGKGCQFREITVDFKKRYLRNCFAGRLHRS